MEVKHPQVTVQLTGEDGNAFLVMGKVTKAMKRAGCTPAEVEAFRAEAMSGDYDHLLQTCMLTVNVE